MSSSLRSSINTLLPTFLTDAIDWIVATYAKTSTCSTVRSETFFLLRHPNRVFQRASEQTLP